MDHDRAHECARARPSLFGQKTDAERAGAAPIAAGERPHLGPHDRWIDGLSMSHDDETWQIIGAFAIVCALLSAMIMTL